MRVAVGAEPDDTGAALFRAGRLLCTGEERWIFRGGGADRLAFLIAFNQVAIKIGNDGLQLVFAAALGFGPVGRSGAATIAVCAGVDCGRAVADEPPGERVQVPQKVCLMR
ncbi:hypothetical protein [Oceaniovalibus sp. ACAM 378]|uniref:hypothetical protein n=1 Tax=Oceaniovalibus sp. ACAM 378 TaxID=2599923 RepID=UPI0011D52A6C|nr:hypothetical protein [Oceaniovalibus sp. ACAM 378]TYB89775.1 hypothetical protein FQ320_06560 [Oceaniovalibus sp. ACAM 378]